MLSRRVFLTSVSAFAATPALAAAPMVSMRPVLRPADSLAGAIPSAAELVAEARLGGRVGYAVADAITGEMLEMREPRALLPPASVTKAITCAYALDRLDPSFRFQTRLLADGPLRDGRLDGDLWLVGSGDPMLDTDRLAAMVAALRAQGLTEVTGRLRLADAAMPRIFEIDPDQPRHAGYNPAISGLNLNFNRVYFEWVRQGGDYSVVVDARSDRHRPKVGVARVEIAERSVPVFTYDQVEGRDHWTVARGALGETGGRWLPVRRPSAYVGEVFAVLARDAGLRLGGVAVGGQAPEGAALLQAHQGDSLEEVLRSMMRWSTNLTAEVMGLAATQSAGLRPEGLGASAAAMSDWMRERLGASRARFVDHSGLGDQSRLCPEDMVTALVAAGPDSALRRLMRQLPMRDGRGNPVPDHPVEIMAKTGTLNFVSSLAGYARLPSGRDVAFAIFCADTDRRAALSMAERERPEGARPYNTRAKRLQQQLIERWAALYA